MTTLALSTSMGANLLYATKGDSNLIAIDHTTGYDSTAYNADSASFTAGRGMTLSSGKWVAGMAAVGSIPYFAYSGLDTNNLPDVYRTRGMPYANNGQFVCWSVFNRIRIATTAINTSATFTVGTPVTISAAASAAGRKGLLTDGNGTTNPTVGFVAPAGKYTNAHGYSVVEIDLHYIAGSGTPALVTL